MPEHPQAGRLRLLDHRAQLVVGDRQVHLDVIDAGGLQRPDVGARLVRRAHVAAIGGRRAPSGPVTRAPDTNSRGPLIRPLFSASRCAMLHAVSLWMSAIVVMP